MTVVGDLLELRYGKALKADDRDGGDVPVVGSGGIVGGHSSGITPGPTIVVGRKGSIGTVTWIDGPAWPIDTAYFVNLKRSDVDFRWVYWLLASLKLASMNRSAAVPGLNREDVYRLSVHLPKLEEQRRIAAILDHADALRSKQSEILSRIGQLPQALYLEAFGDPAENPRGFPRVPLRALAVKMSDGPFGSNLKTEHYVDEGVPVVRLQNIGVGAYLPDNKAFIAESHFLRLRKHECHPGDLLIGTLGDPNLRACLQPSYLPRALNKADCVQLRVDEAGADPRWVMWMLNMPGTLILASALVLGQTRSRIAMGRLRELEVPVPPLEQQRLFGRRVARVEQLRDEAVRADRASGELFASLQTRAFRGEL